MASKPQLPPLQLLPERIRTHPAICTQCKSKFPLKPELWFTEHKREPFDFKNPHLAHMNRLVQVNPPQVECPHCRGMAFIMPVLNDDVSTIELHVDETNRQIGDGKYVYIFAAVGTEQQQVQALNQRVWDLKKELDPNRDPTTWPFHMKVLTASHQRAKHAFMKDWDRAKVERAKTGLWDILRNNQDTIFKFVVAVPHPNNENWAKRSAFYMLALWTFDVFAELNRGVRLVFDSQKEVKPGQEGKPVIHSWATAEMERFRNMWLYTVVTRLVEMPEPVFVKPGSQPAAELADVVAFTVGRAVEKRANEEPLTPDPAVLGLVHWMGLADEKKVTATPSVGVPWDKVLAVS